MTEAPLPISVTGSVPATDGSLPSQETPQTPVTELTPEQRLVADAIKDRVSKAFTGVDTSTPGTYGYNTYVDRTGRGTRATRFRDGFLDVSLSQEPGNNSYALHRNLYGNSSGYQREEIFFHDLTIGESVGVVRSRNIDPDIPDEIVVSPAAIEYVAREFGIQSQPH